MHPEPHDPAVEAEAIDWLIRQRDPAFAAWDDFADWLARDPGHAAVYDALAMLDADLDALPKPASPVIREQPAPRRFPRRAWFGGAIAAALVVTVGLPGLRLFDGANRIETAAGEHRTVELADGSRIEINGGSVVELDTDRPRFARLESGEAMFHVVHRDEAPFVVETGDARLVDLGTAFNVIRRARATSVAVSEGIVVYNPGRDNVRMGAGQGIEARDGDRAPPKVRTIDAAGVGGWRSGQLVYSNAPLATVAEDLRRTAGIRLTLGAGTEQRGFSGALIVDKDGDRTVRDLAALSGTRAERHGKGWILTR